MKIILIFRTLDQALYSVKFDKENDEFDRLFDSWQDIQYLESFFENNKNDLPFFGKMTVDDAVMQTRNDTKELQKQLLDIKNGKNSNSLNNYFIPLDNITYRSFEELEKCKSYGILEKGWIRLYAIRVPPASYVVTGGAIKLTKKMAERPHTLKELDKLNIVMDFLRKEGIFDEDGLKDFLN